MKLRKVVLLSASVLLALSLTGCDATTQYTNGQEREERMYQLCIKSGGDWFASSANNEIRCTMSKEKK